MEAKKERRSRQSRKKEEPTDEKAESTLFKEIRENLKAGPFGKLTLRMVVRRIECAKEENKFNAYELKKIFK